MVSARIGDDGEVEVIQCSPMSVFKEFREEILDQAKKEAG